MNPKWQIVIANCVLVSVLVKGVVIPSWSTALELVAALAFVGVRWIFEPKPVPPASKSDIDEVRAVAVKLSEQLKVVDTKVGQARLALGLKG